MNPSERRPWPLPPWLGLLAASLVVTLGTYWAFDRGAPDFTVFHSAWRLVLEGRGAEIYRVESMPDRFLYAPGFAWLLSPLGLLPRSLALALWCFAKAAVVGYLVREFRPRAMERVAGAGIAGLGVAVFARPLLIDFQYGQVNTLILGACAWALLSHFKPPAARRSGAGDFAAWAVLAIAAVAKVFPLPLLAVPWLVRGPAPAGRARLERLGIAAGLALVLAAPMLTQGWDGTVELMRGWQGALVAKGLPTESHNQSFAAFLHHYFSGGLTHVVALGPGAVPLGAALIGDREIGLLSLAWLSLTAGFLLAWLMSGARRPPLAWAAVLLAALILPSHLVWKPYFVMALPLAMLAAGQAASGRAAAGAERRTGWALLAVFGVVNLTGFDLWGHHWGARLEAASLMLWAELALIWIVARGAPVSTGS